MSFNMDEYDSDQLNEVNDNLREINANIRGFGLNNALSQHGRHSGEGDAAGWLMIGIIAMPIFIIWGLYKIGVHIYKAIKKE